MKKILTKFVLLIFVFFLVLGAIKGVDATMSSENYQIDADAFGVSGQEGQTSENYQLSETVGEVIADSASSTSENYAIKSGFREMYADVSLTFSVGASAVNFGILSPLSAAATSHTMTVLTNAAGGFSIAVSGNTLTSGANTIDAIGAVAQNSNPGTEQFGINLAANASPTVGVEPTGSAPIGSAASQYNLTDLFAYNSGDIVASSSAAVNQTEFTVSYIANMADATEQGNYSTTLTYTATANW